MRKTVFILVSMFFLGYSVYGQSINQVLRSADSTFKQKDYYRAYVAYGDALKYDSNRVDIRYKMAEAARLYNSFNIASKNYVKVLASKDRQKYPEARLRLGETLHKMGEYKSALSSYQEYLTQNPQASPENLVLAQKGIKDCEYAIKFLAKLENDPNPEKLAKAASMGPRVNGPFTDYGPSFRKDTLFHTSYEFTEPGDKNTYYNKVVKTYSGVYKEPVGPWFNTPKKHTAYSAFTPDDKGVYYCQCEPINAFDLRCDIYFRDLTNPGATPIKLAINQPTPITNTSPSVGKNAQGEQVLYFVSNRPGGKGKLDIWMGPIQADGNVTSAVPVNEFNTPGNDISPFYYATKDKTLFFFSSDGWPTLGGFDVNGSRLNSNGKWGIPFNLKLPTNTSYDEFGYIRNMAGDTAIFASNRPGSILLEENQEACCHDLFKAPVNKLVYLKVNTFRQRDSVALLGASVGIFDQESTSVRKELLNKTDPTGNHYITLIERDKKYAITAGKKGFIGKDSLVLANIDEDVDTLEVDVYLPDLKLDVFTLLGPFGDDRPPLTGCTVTLYEKNASGQFIQIGSPETRADDHEYNYEVELNKVYLVKATKTGFTSDSTEVPIDQNSIRQFGYDVSVDLFLTPASLEIDLYFDNAVPGPNPATTTTREYRSLLETYLKQEDKFSGLVGGVIRAFFQNQVKNGYRQLEERIPGILQELNSGRSVKIYMAGFASPLGNAVYNQRLGARRMSSVINFLGMVNNGALKKYIDTQQLSFDLKAVGEDPSKPDLPDALNSDGIRNAIYNIEPSLERKVRIYRIEIKDPQPKK